MANLAESSMSQALVVIAQLDQTMVNLVQNMSLLTPQAFENHLYQVPLSAITDYSDKLGRTLLDMISQAYPVGADGQAQQCYVNNLSMLLSLFNFSQAAKNRALNLASKQHALPVIHELLKAGAEGSEAELNRAVQAKDLDLASLLVKSGVSYLASLRALCSELVDQLKHAEIAPGSKLGQFYLQFIALLAQTDSAKLVVRSLLMPYPIWLKALNEQVEVNAYSVCSTLRISRNSELLEAGPIIGG